MKKGATADAKREAERLMSRIVLRDGVCVYVYHGVGKSWYCGRPATDCAHVLAKGRHASIRYNITNGLPLCRMHHEELGSAKLAESCPMRRLYITLMGEPAWQQLLTAASRRRPAISQILTELRALAREKGVA
jgi:hypothetical protein